MKSKKFTITVILLKEMISLGVAHLNIVYKVLLEAQGERYVHILEIDYDKRKIAWNDPEIEINIKYT